MKINYPWNNEAFIYVLRLKICPKHLKAGSMPTSNYRFSAHKILAVFLLVSKYSRGLVGVHVAKTCIVEFERFWQRNVLVFQVHAKHEEKSDTKSVYREYNREFLLPKGTNPEAIKSSLSRDGVLTVEAPLPQLAITDRNIPIQKHWACPR